MSRRKYEVLGSVELTPDVATMVEEKIAQADRDVPPSAPLARLEAAAAAAVSRYTQASKNFFTLYPPAGEVPEGYSFSLPPDASFEIRQARDAYDKAYYTLRYAHGAVDLYHAFYGTEPATEISERWEGLRTAYTSKDREYPLAQLLPETYPLGIRYLNKTYSPSRMGSGAIKLFAEQVPFVGIGLTVDRGSSETLTGYWLLPGTDRVLVLRQCARYHDFNAIMLRLEAPVEAISNIRENKQLHAYAALHRRHPRIDCVDEGWGWLKDIWWIDDLDGLRAELAAYLNGDTMHQLRAAGRIFGH